MDWYPPAAVEEIQQRNKYLAFVGLVDDLGWYWSDGEGERRSSIIRQGFNERIWENLIHERRWRSDTLKGLCTEDCPVCFPSPGSPLAVKHDWLPFPHLRVSRPLNLSDGSA